MLQHLWMALLRCASARWQLAAQAFNQAIERIKRAKLDCQLAYFLEFATSLHTLFDTNFNFGCKQVGEFGFYAAHVGRFFFFCFLR